MKRLSPFLRRYGFDLLIVLAAIEGALELVSQDDLEIEPSMPLWLAAPAIAIVALTLLARRRLPFAAPASVFVLSAALSFADGRLIVSPTSIFVVGMAAAFLLGNLRDAVQARLGLAVLVSGAAIISYNDPSHAPGDLVFLPVLFGILWLVGFAMRERTDQAMAAEMRATHAERERETAARIAVAEERTRIAQELHDVIAHNVSLIVVQAQALGATHGDERVANATEGIADLGRATMSEMHRTLRLLRADDEAPSLAPQPGLGDLDELLARLRASGLPVELAIEGPPRVLARSVDLSAFRIVQEALTNVVKHAGRAPTAVTIAYGTDALELTIVDSGSGERVNGRSAPPSGQDTNGVDGVDGDGRDGRSPLRGGHGLIGMRERAALFGGTLIAGTRPTTGFEVRASLPYDEGIA